ncbi:MAG TPA: type IX secretion system membrane protein PorP/SprF [Elusimicrobiota bacterium]|nr:type IX secretion system membrane protein PorP/SprF [Elusimicrobiota bacterium]
MAPRARACLAALLGVSLLAGRARAAYDDVGTSARVTGMGMAYTAVADDAYTIYYNPAGLATLDRPEFASTYSRLLTGLSDGSNIQNSFLAYEHPLDDGRKGTVGAALNYFTLDSLYHETSLFASYGRTVTREDNPSPVLFGVTGKYLNRTLGGTSAASNSITNTGVVTNTPDPVLQSTSKTNFDADLGALWKLTPNWSLGMQIQHVLEPNIAFSPSQSDPLGRNYKLGGAYHTPFSTLSTDVDFINAPDGSLDKDFSVGIEKWLPTLLYGSFAVRGGLGFGSRDYRALSLGLSYKIHRMQFDYGFAIPVGGLTQTSGSQRVGLTWRFGAPKQADALLGEMLLENLASSAQVGTPEFNKQAAELVAYKRKAVDLLMRDADAEAQLGRFENAHQRSRQAASLAPRDTVLAELDERYRTAGAYFPDLSEYLHTPGGAATHDGVMKFIEGKDKEALVSLANARALMPSPAHDGLIRVLEAKVGAPAPAVSTSAAVAPPAEVAASTTAVSASSATAVVSASTAPVSGAEALKRILDSTSALMEVSFFQQEWDKVIKLADQVIALDPGNVLAYKRLAGAYHATNRHAEALKALKAAYALEPDEAEREKLKAYVGAMRALVEKENRPVVARAVKKAAGGPEDVERLYEAGVELYAQGRLIEAREAFKRCLQIDENYTPAQRAFQRVQSEMMATGQEK